MTSTYWLFMIGAALTLGGKAIAQTQTYETPHYTTPRTDGLDPNYGMPTFGTTGSELPSLARTRPNIITNDKSDFYDSAPDRSEPRLRRPPSGFVTEMETPSYTTQDGQEQAVPPSYDSSDETK